MVPGNNDYHAIVEKDADGKDHVRVEPGLGDDEPRERPKRMDPAVIAALRAQGEELDQRAKTIEERERELDERQARLDRMERQLRDDVDAKVSAE